MSSASAQLTTFSDSDIAGLAPAMKIGLLATVNDEGLPHLTLLSTLRAASPASLTFGQFTEGLSKRHVRRNPHVGFLVMSLQKELWRGTATFSHVEKNGPDYDSYNNEPLFRYNAYFGIHTVYYLDLVGHTGRQSLPMGGIIAASLATAAARAGTGSANNCKALNQW
ncbi:MAG: pyridoxamine 5'-phosphate oxidase family protein, partial [Spirochaetia bacterium]